MRFVSIRSWFSMSTVLHHPPLNETRSCSLLFCATHPRQIRFISSLLSHFPPPSSPYCPFFFTGDTIFLSNGPAVFLHPTCRFIFFSWTCDSGPRPVTCQLSATRLINAALYFHLFTPNPSLNFPTRRAKKVFEKPFCCNEGRQCEWGGSERGR